jgi:hypothetical protein
MHESDDADNNLAKTPECSRICDPLCTAPLSVTAPSPGSGYVLIGGERLHVDSWTTLPSTIVSTERIFLISTSGTEK